MYTRMFPIQGQTGVNLFCHQPNQVDALGLHRGQHIVTDEQHIWLQELQIADTSPTMCAGLMCTTG